VGHAIDVQRRDIARVATQVLARLAVRKHQLVHRYETVPLLALEVGADAVAELEVAGFWVKRVVADNVNAPMLPESIPLIGADQAWNRSFDGSGVVVAILDTGVQSDHPFLAGKVVEEACYSSTFSGTSTTLCPNGQSQQIGTGAGINCSLGACWHGTHVAGIAAGNGAGAGVAFSGVAKGAQIMAVQVFSQFNNSSDCNGSPPCVLAWDSDMIAGLERVYALRSARNFSTVNLSLGGASFTSPCDSQPHKPIIDNLRSVGIATVIAAGNAGATNAISEPACISSAISVGATTKSDAVASYSNVSPFMSLFAPGSSIYSSIVGGGFGYANGTSMATPHVTGAWALLKQAAPGASVDQVLAALQQTGLPITDTRAGGSVTKPRIRVDQALSIVAPAATQPVNVALQANGGVASASTMYSSGFPPGAVNDGDRKGLNPGVGGYWNDATPSTFPDWVQVTFNGPQSITEIDVFALQDNYLTPVEPTPTMTFTNYGVVDFDVQYWTGTTWVTVPGGSITGNSHVWTRLTFPALTTDRIRVVVNRAVDLWSRIVEIEAWSSVPLTPPPPGTSNVALQVNGGVASASSAYSSGFPASAVNDGDRKGVNPGVGGYWNDATPYTFPDWVGVTFNGPKTITEIDVFTLQDNYLTPVEPTPTMTFTNYGVVDFDVQYWTGTAWVDVPGGRITGNTQVWTRLSFPALMTDRIRVVVNRAVDLWSRIVEIEAWGN